MMLRHGSVVSRLENDQLVEDEGAPVDRAYRRGWNAAVRHILAAVRSGRAFSTWTLDATGGDEISRAYARGHNAGQRHAVDIRMKAALRELAYAPLIRTIDLGEEKR